MTRINFVCLASTSGAFTDHFYTLCAGQAKLGKYDIHVFSSCRTPPPTSFIADHCSLRLFNYSKSNPLTALFASFRIIPSLSRREDILLLYGELPQHLLLAIFARSRVVAHIADYCSHPGTSLPMRVLFVIAKFILFLKADAVYVSSCHARREILKCYSFIFRFLNRRASIYSVPFGLMDSFAQCLGFQPDYLGSTLQDSFDLVFFGRNEPYKGLSVFLEHLSQWSLMRNHHLTMLIVSRGFKPVSLPGINIRLIDDFLPSPELMALIAHSRFCALPYNHVTGSHVVQNANVCGTPVIATAIGCFLEQVEPFVNGYLYDVNSVDQLYSVLDFCFAANVKRDPSGCLSGADLIQYALSRFDTLHEAARLCEVFDEILEPPPRCALFWSNFCR
jgi:glycosyltransferase involved in cell wall biosynthesis